MVAGHDRQLGMAATLPAIHVMRGRAGGGGEATPPFSPNAATDSLLAGRLGITLDHTPCHEPSAKAHAGGAGCGACRWGRLWRMQVGQAVAHAGGAG
eukprot:361719-Chlamydomonas_euryale.AAC.7